MVSYTTLTLFVTVVQLESLTRTNLVLESPDRARRPREMGGLRPSFPFRGDWLLGALLVYYVRTVCCGVQKWTLNGVPQYYPPPYVQPVRIMLSEKRVALSWYTSLEKHRLKKESVCPGLFRSAVRRTEYITYKHVSVFSPSTFKHEIYRIHLCVQACRRL